MTTELETVVMLPAHPCYLGKGEFEHDWEFQDDSFDHEFGTERIHYWMCPQCGETREMESSDYYVDDVW